MHIEKWFAWSGERETVGNGWEGQAGSLGLLSGIPRGEITSGKGCIFEGLWYTWLSGLPKGCFNIHFTGCSLDLRLRDEEGQGL